MNSYAVPALLLALMLSLGCGTVGLQNETEETEASQDTSQTDPDTILTEGTFEGKEGITTSGSYRIVREASDVKLILGESFQTETGPDLYVVLSPKSPGKATGENVMNGEAMRINTLNSLGGKQTYDLQDDLNLDPFKSVAIQCIQYSHLYGVADLK